MEALYNAIRAKPDAHLAVPKVETIFGDRPNRILDVPRLGKAGSLANINTLLFQSHAAWFCGLWEVKIFRPVFERVWSRYVSPWGPDHLAVYRCLLDETVAFAPEAVFIQRITPKESAGAARKPRLRDMMQLRRIFLQVCRDFRRDLGISGTREKALAVMTWFYTGKRVFKVRNIVRYSILGRW